MSLINFLKTPLRDLSIRTKLVAAFAVMGAFTAIIGYQAYQSLTRLSVLNARAQSLFVHDLMGISAIEEAAIFQVKSTRVLRDAVLATGDQEAIADQKDTLEEMETSVADSLDAADKAFEDAASKEKLAEVREKLPAYHIAAEKIMLLASEGDREGAKEMLKETNSLANNINLTIAETARLREEAAQSSRTGAEATYKRVRLPLILLAFGALILGAVFCIQLVRYIGIGEEITQRRRSEAGLRLLASIVNSSPDAIFGQSPDGKITTWNPAAERIFSYSQSEIIGVPANILQREDQDAEASLIAAQVHQGQGIQDFKTERRRKDGVMVAVSLTASPLRDEVGTIIGTSIQAHNISERKKLEDRLSIVSEQLRAVLETTNEYVIALDKDWCVTYQNRLPNGADPSTSVGKNLWESSPYIVGTSLEHESRKAMSERKPYRFEEYFATLKTWISGVAYPTGSGLLILGQDDTEKHALDDQLRSAQKMEAIGNLAAGVAHEINTPIQYIGDNASFLKDSWSRITVALSAAQRLRDEMAKGTALDAAMRDFDICSKQADLDFLAQEVPLAIDQTLDGVNRVAKIVEAMKEFSHPGSEEKRAVDLNRAVETTATVSRNEWKYVAEVLFDLEPNLPLVACLGGEINQVLLNLLVNAAHAIADVVLDAEDRRGTITVSTRSCAEYVEIAIADTGTGIPEQVRDKVFDPFFTTKEVGKGTGQGLMLAQTVIVKKHGGTIWFDSEMGKGTTFFIRLPIVV
jgi:PAS domain S-box-containing protein